MSGEHPYLPHEAEPVESMRARWAKALEPVYDARDLEKHPERTPGKKRQHVFDFSNGMRWIVSRDILEPDDRPRLHISASFVRGSMASVDIVAEKKADAAMCRAMQIIHQHVEKLGVIPKGAMFKMLVSSEGVIHLIEMNEQEAKEFYGQMKEPREVGLE